MNNYIRETRSLIVDMIVAATGFEKPIGNFSVFTNDIKTYNITVLFLSKQSEVMTYGIEIQSTELHEVEDISTKIYNYLYKNFLEFCIDFDSLTQTFEGIDDKSRFYHKITFNII